MSGGARLAGGLIERERRLRFTFDGQVFEGHPGDTLASALLANGKVLMGRSFKYHRPRGPFSAGSEEPNALVTLRTGARAEPNTRATTAELYEGLEARSQNRWPSLALDLMAVNDLLAPFLGAGFYYKTFMWPRAFWEKLYEPLIRRAAGLGRLSSQPDPDAYESAWLHCDLLVVGAGPAGLAAALTAARSGARVVLADEDFRLGGRLLAERGNLADRTGPDWVGSLEDEFERLPNLRVLRRTTVFGAFDHGVWGALERVADHLAEPLPDMPRQRLLRIVARRTLICTGATERPMAFAGNDRPGVMLASALRAYANRWAVPPPGPVAIFTNNDDGHRTAADLSALGCQVAGVIDMRPQAPQGAGYEVFAGAHVRATRGRLALRAIEVETAGGRIVSLPCRMLGISGGWNPNIQLSLHRGGRPAWSDELAAFLPGTATPADMRVAGAASGDFSTRAALTGGAAIARAALSELGIAAETPDDLPEAEDAHVRITPCWHVPGKGRAFVDLQHDVTVKDIGLAHAENMRSVEHLKRYTTLGMATDQGRTSGVIGLAVMAELAGRSIPETGTTTFRPPYGPVAIGAFAGDARGPGFRPVRLAPSQAWAVEQGAVFVEAGQWMRAQYFPRPGETHWRESVDREVLAVRSSVGLCDVTTLGKIDVQGADAAAFLDRIYCNAMASLKVGRSRYGLMLREDGHAMDDGTAARLAEDHFVVTTTTANAGPVFRHLEFARQCLWPGLDVQLVSTTDAWAQIAVAGPGSRALIARVIDGFDLSDEAFPFMACASLRICGGLRARLFRISFSGELAYEIAVPARFGDALMRRLMSVGADLGVTPYGTEALGVLRIEKGHAAGNELNGQTTAQMLGLGRMVSTRKAAIGAVMSRRPGLLAETRVQVGLVPVDPADTLPGGAHLFAEGAPRDMRNDLGWISSSAHSPHLGHAIALAFLEGGAERMGQTVIVANPLEGAEMRARVVSPHFIDPEGVRLRG
ncbi:MAG: sarcosine oxidase subunit alpha family protein [Rhodobacteraceae bacterium]|nr:sarcosine oxidase subunit alpha family protein [Paracoccaceae bacterium]